MGGSAGAGGTAASCTGAGICGHGPTGIYCARSNGANAFTAWSQWSDKFSDSDSWKTMLAYWATIEFPDINGDGKADVCGRAMAGITCGLSSGAGTFLAPTLWSVNGFTDAGGWNSNAFYWATIQYPDINGDGKADVCGRGAGGISCEVSTGVNGFGPTTLWSTGFTDAGGWNTLQSYWGTIQYPDVNGDGKADICGRGAGGVGCAISNGTDGFTAGGSGTWSAFFADAMGWNSSPSHWGTIRYPDINGDGRADICGRMTEGVWCAIPNGTNGFGPVAVWSAEFGAAAWSSSQSYWATILFPDINGDGKADICGRGAGGVVCGISNGTPRSALQRPGPLSSATPPASTVMRRCGGTIQYPDLDGDGKADICGRTATGIYCGLSNGTSGFAVAAWLDQFTDANGWKTDLSYGATLQTPNLNLTACAAVTKKSTYSPIVRRLAPF